MDDFGNESLIKTSETGVVEAGVYNPDVILRAKVKLEESSVAEVKVPETSEVLAEGKIIEESLENIGEIANESGNAIMEYFSSRYKELKTQYKEDPKKFVKEVLLDIVVGAGVIALFGALGLVGLAVSLTFTFLIGPIITALTTWVGLPWIWPLLSPYVSAFALGIAKFPGIVGKVARKPLPASTLIGTGIGLLIGGLPLAGFGAVAGVLGYGLNKAYKIV